MFLKSDSDKVIYAVTIISRNTHVDVKWFATQ